MASEQFSLCWDNFHKNMSSGMNSLLENEDLVDVTLAVEGKMLKAHKMVLSVCSPYFKDLFKSNPCQHPIVFMKDVSYVALSDLLQFMYQGEVQVSQENLTTFIKTAEALQIKGLTGDGNGSADDVNESTHDDRTSHQAPEPVPIQVPRPKKIPAPPVSAPAPKRQRTSTSFDSTPSVVHTPQIQTKQEPVSSTPSSTDQIVQFKMEPHDNTQSMAIHDDNPDDTFGDDQMDDNNAEDAEEYSMMEGNEEEPQAGTSTETAGEGQGTWAVLVQDNPKIDRKQEPVEPQDLTYLICSEYKKLVCKARAVIPANGSIQDLVLRTAHNHPPTHEASIRDVFIRELKKVVMNNPMRPLKILHQDIGDLYLGCAEQKKSGCRGRATLPVGGTLDQLKVTRQHNHPPDVNAEEKQEFLIELKKAVRATSMENVPLKKVYELIAEGYLRCCKMRSVGCKGRAVIPVNGSLDDIKIFQQHNHPEDEYEQLKQDFLTALRQACESNTCLRMSLKQIYKNVAGTYLRCLEYKRLGCHARAVIPYDGSIQDIKVNKPHNHPPDIAAEEKIIFMRELKEVMLKNPNVPSRTVYATLSEMYPNAARETPFESIRHKMNRWRRQND